MALLHDMRPNEYLKFFAGRHTRIIGMNTYESKEGDRVIWKSYFAAGQPPLRIPAVVKSITPYPVTIDALLLSERQRLWVIWRVSPKDLSARTHHFPELDSV